MSVTSARGLVVPIDEDAIKTVRGVVILDLPAERRLPSVERTTLYAGVSESSGVLVHAFLSDEFDVMLQELDTLPDFLAYLEFREQMYGAGKVDPMTRNLDLLAAYKIHYELRTPSEQQKVRVILVEDGMWEHYLEAYAVPRERRRIEDEPSFVIDDVIENLAAMFAGYERELAEEWLRMVRELARFTRMQRRVIGGKWRGAMLRALKNRKAFSVCRLEEIADEVFVVYAGPEGGRAEALHSLAAMAREHFDVKRAVAFGTGPPGAPSTMQMATLEDGEYSEEVRAELRDAARKTFGPKHHARTFEYAPSEVVLANSAAAKRNAPAKPKKRKKKPKNYGRQKKRKRKR